MSVTTYDYAGYSYDAPVSYDNPLQQLGIGCRISAPGGCQGNTIYNATGVSYNQPLYIYNPTVCPNGSLSIQARISKHTAQTLLIRADIQNRSAQTFTCQANIIPTGAHTYTQAFTCQVRIMPYRLAIQASIKNTVLHQIAMKVWFSRQQGFPIIDPSNPAFSLFQPTQLVLKANIVNNIIQTSRTLLVNCRISPRRSASMLMNCRINRSGRLSIQASITPKYKTTTVLGSFDIAGAFALSTLGYFNVNGLFSQPVIGVGANIIRTVTRHVCGHFVIPAQTTTSPVDIITASGASSSRANIGIGAFIS